MKIVIKNPQSKYLEIISLRDLDKIDENLKNFSSIKEPVEVIIFSINESISSLKLLEIKNIFFNINIQSLRVYSSDRDTVIAGKYLKIDSTFAKEQEIKNKLFLLNSKKQDDILHEGTVRSGDRISSNGNLCIIGDVNPGAIVSAKKNIYVWGKLQGIAYAGKDGNNHAFIASLFLNPLQLRIADVIAIGPKDKPKNDYPEIAVIQKKTINIKPYLMQAKN